MTDEMKPMEIELKLVLPGMEAEETLVACLRENDYRVEELDPVRNIDTYLDTFDWSLFKNKLSLRYRVANGSALYTLKSVGSIEEGIAKRMETEVKLDGPVDIPAAVSREKDPQAGGRGDLSAETHRAYPGHNRSTALPGCLPGGGGDRAGLRHFEFFAAGSSEIATGAEAERARSGNSQRPGCGARGDGCRSSPKNFIFSHRADRSWKPPSSGSR